MRIIIFHTYIPEIGGVETFTYNMSQLADYYDVMLLYGNCHPKQLERLSQKFYCEKYDPQKQYECEILLLATSWGKMPENITSTQNKYWQMIHANYEEITKRVTDFKYEPWHKVTKFIAVSNTVAQAFKRLYGFDCVVMYNVQYEKQPLRLISATRLTVEKGYERMKLFAKKLKESKIDFEWRIFTNFEMYGLEKMTYPEIKYLPPKYDLVEDIRWADYGVQLSDTEGYCYFVNECLFYGTPTITTDFDSVHESVTDGVNGYILKKDLSDLDINKIVNNIPGRLPYKLNTTIKDWRHLIGRKSKKGVYEDKMKNIVNVRVTTIYFDTMFNRTMKVNEEFSIPYDRALILANKGKVKILKKEIVV